MIASAQRKGLSVFCAVRMFFFLSAQEKNMFLFFVQEFFFSFSTQRKVYILFSAQGKDFLRFLQRKCFLPRFLCNEKLFPAVRMFFPSFCTEKMHFFSLSTQRKCFPCFLKSKRFSISVQRKLVFFLTSTQSNAFFSFSVSAQTKIVFSSLTEHRKVSPVFSAEKGFFSYVLHNEKLFFFVLWESFSYFLHRGKFLSSGKTISVKREMALWTREHVSSRTLIWLCL